MGSYGSYPIWLSVSWRDTKDGHAQKKGHMRTEQEQERDLRETNPAYTLDLRHPASRTMRKQMSVLKTTLTAWEN